MQVDATFHQKQAETSARASANVAAAMECVEQVLLIFFRDANPFIADYANDVTAGSGHK